MADITSIRKKYEDMIYKFLVDVEKDSTYNADRYAKKFKSMSNNEFTAFMKKIATQSNFSLSYQLNGIDDKNVHLERVLKLLKKYKIDLSEYIVFPHKSHNGKPMVSNTPVLVFPGDVRKMQQMNEKKNNISGNTDTYNPKTNQVTGKSKATQISDTQMFALLTNGLKSMAKESSNLRGDNEVSTQMMLSEIAKNGKCNLHEGNLKAGNKQSVMYANYLLRAAGISSDMVKNNSFSAQENYYDNTLDEYEITCEGVNIFFKEKKERQFFEKTCYKYFKVVADENVIGVAKMVIDENAMLNGDNSNAVCLIQVDKNHIKDYELIFDRVIEHIRYNSEYSKSELYVLGDSYISESMVDIWDLEKTDSEKEGFDFAKKYLLYKF